MKARNRAYWHANVDARKARERVYRATNADAIRARNLARNLKRRYGLTLDDYNQMLDDQLGLCANEGCFNEPPIDSRFDIDHNHACCSGKTSCGDCIRGLLCGNCNRALGMLGDDVKRIRGLADYLGSIQ